MELQESKYSLVFRSAMASNFILLRKKVDNIPGMKSIVLDFHKLKKCAETSILRAFSQCVVDWKPDLPHKQFKVIIATLVNAGILDKALQKTKSQLQLSISYVWQTIFRAYINNPKEMDAGFDILWNKIKNANFKTFDIPDQIKCMDNAMFASFLQTLIQYLSEILKVYKGLLIEIRFTVQEIMLEKDRGSQNVHCRVASAEEALSLIDSVQEYLLGIMIKILNDLFVCRKSRNASINLSDMKTLWDSVKNFLLQSQMWDYSSTMILRQTMKSQLRTLLEGFHDRNTAWLLQSLEKESWNLHRIPDNITDFIGHVHMGTSSHHYHGEKRLKNVFVGNASYLSKSVTVLLHILSLHVHFLKSFNSIGTEIVGRLLIILNIYENRFRQLLVPNQARKFRYTAQDATTKILCVLQNCNFIVTFLQSLASFFHTGQFDHCFRQTSAVWNGIISRYIDLKVAVFEKLSNIIIDQIESYDIHTNRPINKSGDKLLKYLNASKIIRRISMEYENAKGVLSGNELAKLFTSIISK